MPLGKQLQKIIGEAGYMNSEVMRECNKIGVSVEKSTFSRMLNGNIKRPNEDYLKAIAKVCNVDENRLLIEMDFDNCPERIKEIFYDWKYKTQIVAIRMFENKFEFDIEKEIKNNIKNEPMIDFILSMINCEEDTFDIKDGFNKMLSGDTQEFANKMIDNLDFTIGATISDNVMNPIVTENSKVTFEIKNKNDYKDNDIVLIKIKKTEKFIARYIRFENDYLYLNGIDSNYKTEIYNEKDIIIMGKIKSVTVKI